MCCPAAPSHTVYSGEARNSLIMSAAEAGGVFRRARGRTLDAFPSGTAGLSPGEGMTSRLRNVPLGEPSFWGHALLAGPLWGLHPGGLGTSIAAAPPALRASRGAVERQVSGRWGFSGLDLTSLRVQEIE